MRFQEKKKKCLISFFLLKKKLKYSNGDKLLVAQLAFVTTAVWKIKHCTLLHLPLFATCAYSSCGWSAMASAPSDAELRTATCPRGSRRCRASGWPAAHRFPQIIEGPQGGSPCDQVLLHSKPKWGLGWVGLGCLFIPAADGGLDRSLARPWRARAFGAFSNASWRRRRRALLVTSPEPKQAKHSTRGGGAGGEQNGGLTRRRSAGSTQCRRSPRAARAEKGQESENQQQRTMARRPPENQ
jgi:hypothetical protein